MQLKTGHFLHESRDYVVMNGLKMNLFESRAGLIIIIMNDRKQVFTYWRQIKRPPDGISKE